MKWLVVGIWEVVKPVLHTIINLAALIDFIVPIVTYTFSVVGAELFRDVVKPPWDEVVT